MAKRNAEATPRERTVGKLRKTCELAQGFCLTGLVILILFTVLYAINIASFVTRDDTVLETTTLSLTNFDFTHVDASANPQITVYSGTQAFTFTPSADTPYEDGQEITPREMNALIAGAYERFDLRAKSGWLAYLYSTQDGQLPAVALVQNLATLAFTGALFVLGARFFRHIARSGDPFRPERARELTVAAAVMLAFSFVPGLLARGAVALGPVLVDGFSQVTAGYSYTVLNNALFLTAILLFAFARMWRFGAILQQQDDGLV